MKHRLLIFCIFSFVFISCQNNNSQEGTEFAVIVDQLQNDKNNVFLKTLQPSEDECRYIFLEGESVEKIIPYSESKWVNFDKVPATSMKPETENAELRILSVNTSELRNKKTNGFPEEYLNLADHLREGVTMYAIQYLNADGTEQKHRAAFFKVADRWVIIPQTFRAFE